MSGNRRPLTLLACTAVLSTSAFGLAAPAIADPGQPVLLDDSAIAPHAAAYGYYVDEWDTNTSENLTPSSNAAIGVLGGMEEVWTPGTEWNNGTIVDPAVHESNIAQSVEISSSATDAEQERAYLIDRRHQNYTATEGLGPYTEAYRESVNAGTTIPDAIPAEADTQKFDDGSNSNGAWADADGELGSTVLLVDDIRNHSATSNNAKSYYQYPRPFRWSDDVDMPSYAQPLKKPVEEAGNDGGFPSGHTSAGGMATLGLAYSFPEEYDDLLLTSAEIGTSRIQLGMHSPLDVMGGRTLSTAITAGALNDPALDDVKTEAAAEGSAWIDAQQAAGTVDEDDDYDADLATYTEYLTFGFEQTGDTDEAMRVPKGAEVLLETRMPYLDADQRRWVIYSTGLESGYPVLDDAEGWGRINLFAAQGGYGSFDTDVAVTMDAADGGYSAADAWQNDIDGAGSLTKDGTGSLALTGENSFTGGVTVAGGELRADTASALGTGDVLTRGGTLAVGSTLSIGGSYTQEDGGTLALTAGTDAPLQVAGEAQLGGTLQLAVPEGADLASGITVLEASSIRGEFSDVEISGLPEGVEAQLSVVDGALVLGEASDDDGAGSGSDDGGSDEGRDDQGGSDDDAQAGSGSGSDAGSGADDDADDQTAGGSTGGASEGVSEGAGSGSAGGTSSGTTTSEPPASAGTETGGSLARTGFEGGMLAVAAAGALIIGAGALLVTRRVSRRIG